MKRVTTGALLVATLGISWGIHSYVYACDHSEKKMVVTDAAQPSSRAVAVDVSLPINHARLQRVSIVCDARKIGCDAARLDRYAFHVTQEPAGPVASVRRTAKAAATLGRAFVTTVGAVVGTIVDAAVEATSGLV